MATNGMDFWTRLPSGVYITRYGKQANEMAGTMQMFRVYKNSPDSATIQLRGISSYATASYVTADHLAEMIARMTEVLHAIRAVEPVA